MKTIRRPISILLAVLMVVGMFTMVPISAGAASYVAQVGDTNYESLEEAIAAISTVTPEYHSKSGLTINKYKANGSIKLLADCAGNGIVIDSGSGLTIDFDGHTYTVDGDLVGSNGTESLGFQLKKNSDVTFENGTITSEKAKILVQNYSNLGLYGMTLTLNNTSYNGAYTLSNNNGNAGIHNTTINANPTPGSFAFDVCRYSSYPSVHVEVTGEESVINGNVEISASNGDPQFGFYLNLDGGTMNGDIVVDPSAQTAIEDHPGQAVVNKANTFTQTAPEGFKWVDNGQGGSTLVALPYAAKIDKTKYRTLEEAFAAAQDGDTITLLDDCTGNGIKVPQGKFNNKGLIVDFYDNTYTIDGETVGSSGTETIGFQLLKGNKITFQNGTITGNSNTNQTLQRMIQNYSDLTLDNMTVSMVGRYKDQITVSTCNGKTVINNSTISAPDFTWAGYDDPADVGAAALAVGTFSSYPSIDVTVEGDSTTINGDVNVSDSNNKKAFSLKLNGGKLNGKINLDENAKAAIDDTASTANVTKAADFDQAAPEGYKWVDDGEGNQTLAVANYVAQIGDTNYETLKAALDAAGANDTIELLADCTVDETYLVTKDITIDGNNKTVKATDAVEIFKFDTLTATLTVTDCTFDGDNVGLRAATTQGAKGSNNPNAVIDFTNVTVKNFVADNYAGAVYVFGNSKGNFTNCTITGNKVPAAQADLAYAGADIWAGAAATVTIGGGTYGEVFINANARSASKVIVDGDATVAELALEHDRGDASAELKDANITKLQLNDGYVGNATVTEDTVFAVPEGYKVVEGAIVPVEYVAQIGTAKYETLEAAFAAANDGETITVLADCSGNGIVVPQGKFASGLTVDFAGFTYTVDGETVGSSGTETNGFQLLKGNNITFKGGTITSTKAKILVQNYSNLTLDGMKLTLDNQNYTSAYTLSNNNGNTVIKDTTINANPAGGFAFDVCRFKKGNTYPSVKVTVTGESKINGNVEIFASNKDPKDGFSLNLESGTMSGKIIVDPTAAAAMESAPDKASVNKKNTFEQDPAAGYKWKDNGDGTSTLVKKLFTGHNITLRGDVSLNFFINTKAIENYDPSVPAKVVFTYDGTRTAEVAFADATPASDGVIVATIQVPAAFMAHQIKAVVYYDGEAQAETDEYSIQQYAETLIEHPEYTPAGKNHEDLAKLMMEMLNYGAKAQTVFAGQVKEQATYDDLTEKYDYHMATVTDDMIQAAIDAAPQNAGKTATDLSTVKPEANATFYTASVVFLSESTLKIVFKVPGGSTITGYDGSQKNTYYWVQETDIAAAQLDTLQTFTVGDATFYYSALDYAKVVLKNGNAAAQDLVSALYLYNQAANGYFGANA